MSEQQENRDQHHDSQHNSESNAAASASASVKSDATDMQRPQRPVTEVEVQGKLSSTNGGSPDGRGKSAVPVDDETSSLGSDDALETTDEGSKAVSPGNTDSVGHTVQQEALMAQGNAKSHQSKNKGKGSARSRPEAMDSPEVLEDDETESTIPIDYTQDVSAIHDDGEHELDPVNDAEEDVEMTVANKGVTAVDAEIPDATSQTDAAMTRRMSGFVSVNAAPGRKKRTLAQHEVDEGDDDTYIGTPGGGDTSFMSQKPTPGSQQAARRSGAGVKGPRNSNSLPKGIVVGHWRESKVPNVEGKHSVLAFIDIRDRLRTRIQQLTVTGEPVDTLHYPIPPGPGGSWTTFGGIVFLPHLVGLEQQHIKEFVKIRSDSDPNESAEAKQLADKAAVKEALRRVNQNHAAVNGTGDGPSAAVLQNAIIAFGETIPQEVLENDETRRKKRKLGASAFSASLRNSTAATTTATTSVSTPPHLSLGNINIHGNTSHSEAANTSNIAAKNTSAAASTSTMTVARSHHRGLNQDYTVQPFAAGNPHLVHPADLPLPVLPTTTLDNIVCTRPTKVLVGTWAHSPEDAPKEDRHAIYGVLGMDDLFRVKVMRETVDGRPLDGGIPDGAAGLWVTFNQLNCMDYLEGLSRNEIKEYVRFRQWQIDHDVCNESTNKAALSNNIQIAIDQARIRCKAFFSNGRRDTCATGDNSPNFSTMSTAIDPAPGVKLDGRTKAGRLAKAAAEIVSRGGDPSILAAFHGTPNLPRESRGGDGVSSADRAATLAHRTISRHDSQLRRVEKRQEPMGDSRASFGKMAAAGPSRTIVSNATVGTTIVNDPALNRLDKVWQSQEAARVHNAQFEEAVFHAGVKYQRRTTGPFKNQLTSHGAVVSIDGEDYVEYRVLLKPKFS